MLADILLATLIAQLFLTFQPAAPKNHVTSLAFVLGGLTVLCCQATGLYRSTQCSALLLQGRRILCGSTLACFATTYLLLALETKIMPMHIILWLTATTLALGITRVIGERVTNIDSVVGRKARHVVIIGAGPLSQTLGTFLNEHRELNYVVCGYVDDDESRPGVLGAVNRLMEVASSHFADEIFIPPNTSPELIRKVVKQARNGRIDVKLVPDIYDCCPPRALLVEYLGQVPVLSLHREPIPALAVAAKRAIDITLSALALLAILPILAAIAIAIKIDSGGPVLYRSYRVGKKGRRFLLYKFRTMVPEADQLKDSLRHLNERDGLLFKVTNDPRITRLGRLLRKYSLDELPQFLNVLKGDMSLVGPRPPSPDEFEHYKLDSLRRLTVTPGVTGLWQISARKDPAFGKALLLDLTYIENRSFWLDLKILCKTIPAVLRGEGQ
jgi:exopolysaccharide biosynthesis polyprenyl glycosylphosphotransferase